MILEWLADVMFNLLTWLDGLMPSFSDAEGVLLTVGTFIVPLAAGLASLGVWIPWGTVTLAMSVLVSFYVAAMLMKFALRAAAVIRGGQG